MGITGDIEITNRFAKGDQAAFKELFDLYYKPLCIYAIKFIDSFEDAEDVVQNIFASFWIRYSSRPFSGSLRAYLFSSVRNNCIKLLKYAKNRSITDLDRSISEKDLIQEAEDVIQFLENAENEYRFISIELEKLNLEIEKLPLQCRKVFTAVVMEDMKYKDAAGMLGISVNTVKTQLSRALKTLRSSLGTILMILLIK
ncbi:MAG: RNA polymerase sigma-70 factor [Bacteroidales bacterium]|nr:RNA polymerase sigma-70 factor [Bacteroidales bacterium]MDD2425922.1 RNA polymerase sigma-70 factor [Bacteroidales bacterium]MDD3990338.1 RNA polymerase sigma-70 factor [Bacteroidales bacterium]